MGFDRCIHHSFFFSLSFALFSPVTHSLIILFQNSTTLFSASLEQRAREREREKRQKNHLLTLDVIRFSAASTTPSLASTPSAAPALLMASMAYSTW